MIFKYMPAATHHQHMVNLNLWPLLAAGPLPHLRTHVCALMYPGHGSVVLGHPASLSMWERATLVKTSKFLSLAMAADEAGTPRATDAGHHLVRYSAQVPPHQTFHTWNHYPVPSIPSKQKAQVLTHRPITSAVALQ